jgi:surface protein
MKFKLDLILLLSAFHVVSGRCRRWLGKCAQDSDCCNNRRCMNWGRCGLRDRIPNIVYKCFDNSTELNSGVYSYRKGNETEKERVKGIYGSSIGTWCVNYVTDFRSVFDASNYAGNFNEDVSRWNTSSATKMSFMFYSQAAFNQDLSRWDISKVTTLEGMFEGASSFNKDISSWDVSKVTTFYKMFDKASSFNRDISRWDLSSAVDIARMFADAVAFNKDLCQWGSTFSTYVIATNAFSNTNCPNKNDPNFQGSVVKNMCHDCD